MIMIMYVYKSEESSEGLKNKNNIKIKNIEENPI